MSGSARNDQFSGVICSACPELPGDPGKQPGDEDSTDEAVEAMAQPGAWTGDVVEHRGAHRLVATCLSMTAATPEITQTMSM